MSYKVATEQPDEVPNGLKKLIAARQVLSNEGAESVVVPFQRRNSYTKPVLIGRLIDLSHHIQAVFKTLEIESRTTITRTTIEGAQKSNYATLETLTGAKQIQEQFEEGVYADSLVKTPESIKNKSKREPQKKDTITFKDCTRFTVKLEKPITDLDQMVDLLYKIRDNVCDPQTSIWRLVDRKYKIKANGYSDISLYFYTIFDGKPIITEVQINTIECLRVKHEETDLYNQIKELCTSLPFGKVKFVGQNQETILNDDQKAKIKIDTDLIYTFFRSVMDLAPSDKTLGECIEAFLKDFHNQSVKLVESYRGIFLKENQVPEFNVENPSEELMNQFYLMADIFKLSYTKYIKTEPVLKGFEDITRLTNETESLLQLPYFIDSKGVVHGIDIDHLHPDIIENVSKSKFLKPVLDLIAEH